MAQADAMEYDEKKNIDMLESLSDSDSLGFDEKATKRLVRKIDWVLLPFLALLCLLSFLDRTNIGNARLASIEKDLGMKGLDYNIALAVFFPFYVAAEIPSNLMMKKTRPSIWIPSIMVAWGVVCTLMGLVDNFAGLLAARAALGVAEGSLFPGVTFYITMWYRRHECGLRMAIFFSTATAAGAFGGLLARGIIELGGVSGKAGWAWIFIIKGIVTLIIASIAFVVMYDYLDWKIWVHMFITIGIYTPLYSVSLFLPTIVRTLGYTNETAQLMTVPPYIIACVCYIGGGYLADRLQTRGLFMIGFYITTIIGFIMLLISDNPNVKYAGCFFTASGIYPNVP
ncbi:hypothetical protein H2201_009094 [Coniosporium apollinis]|uniref:Major facilitator superfamily (MFS) profile domain-containing protein n=1 Tax=Coniosporium apollinis TaxID=61459 RepID=A0ABQ9NGK0_9PEZI|nr:hypothetical protein H2201_009094 [Coniosporium apollinis]